MANNIKLVTYAGSTVTPQDDALVYETAVGQNGIMSGCAMAIKNNNTLHISAGHGIVCGRKFSVVESDITVLLTTGDTLAGRVYVHLDLSNTTDPIQIMTETGSSLTEPIQQTDVNISNGIYEFNLATFTIDALTIADLVDVKPIVEKITDKLDNAKVDTLTTLEQVEATTDDTIPVGAGAVKQLNESLPKLFINTTDVIYTTTSLDATWTATKNGYVSVAIKSIDAGDGVVIRIDGVSMLTSPYNGYLRTGFYIKKGQVLSVNKGGGGSVSLSVYSLI